MASTKGSAHSDPTHPQSTQPGSNSNIESNSPNPFLLSASKNPGNILVAQPLLGMKNYQSWSRAIVLTLTAKKKIGFVNGKISMPEIDSPLYEDWESCNTMVLSWLINSNMLMFPATSCIVKLQERCGLNCRISFLRTMVQRFTIYKERFHIYPRIKC